MTGHLLDPPMPGPTVLAEGPLFPEGPVPQPDGSVLLDGIERRTAIERIEP